MSRRLNTATVIDPETEAVEDFVVAVHGLARAGFAPRDVLALLLEMTTDPADDDDGDDEDE